MPKTVQQIVEGGFGLSKFSRPELIADQAGVLVSVVNRAQQSMFQIAARINRLYFSTITEVPLTSGAWQRPSDAESVFYIEGLGDSTTPTLTGEITVIPYNDRAAFAGTPAIYRVGRRFYSAGNSGDPTAGSLRFIYARRPAVLTSLSSTIDPDIDDAFEPILTHEVAIFNANSDGGRDGESTLMTDERDRYIALFEAFLEHETVNEAIRFGEVRKFPTERSVPINKVVRGGQ